MFHSERLFSTQHKERLNGRLIQSWRLQIWHNAGRCCWTMNGKKGKWLPILQSAGKRQHSISFVYRSYHLPMPDPSPSTLTVLTPTSYSSEEGVAAGQRTVYPRWLPVNTVIHTTSDCWSDALPVVPHTHLGRCCAQVPFGSLSIVFSSSDAGCFEVKHILCSWCVPSCAISGTCFSSTQTDVAMGMGWTT